MDNDMMISDRISQEIEGLAFIRQLDDLLSTAEIWF